MSLLSALFSRKPPLDEPSIEWIFATFAWALRHFDAGFFEGETRLVLPSNNHFPGRTDSAHGMAGLIFARVTEYAGLGHWPWRLVDGSRCDEIAPVRMEGVGVRRGAGAAAPQFEGGDVLTVAYDPRLIGNPEALIADFAHTVAWYLAATTAEPPPGGSENLPHATEVVAVFLGFGVMAANSAFNLRPGGCGGCGVRAERSSSLSQHDIDYALALFTALKGLREGEVRPHLKGSLRGHFRDSLRDVAARRAAGAAPQIGPQSDTRLPP